MRCANKYLLATLCSSVLAIGIDPAFSQIVDRSREPIVIRATDALLPDFVDDNYDASTFELWRYSGGSWQIIPFQIDEMSADPVAITALSYASRQCGSLTTFPTSGSAPCEFEYLLRGTAAPSGTLSKNDEIVFLAGYTGACDAAFSSWPSSDLASTRYKIHVSDYNPGTETGETGCVYLYRRTTGTRPSFSDLVDYDTTGDGTAHVGGCKPTGDACGAFKSASADVDGDGTTDVPAWRWDFLGDWAVDKWFIGETTVSSTENMTDLIKWRITNPAETEGNWDGANSFARGCTTFYGYIDGPVRAIRKIGGAASGVLTTKTEYAYPGEVRYEVNVRVHTVGGTVYSYADLLQSNVSSGTNAKVYKSGNTSTAFDDVDGSQPGGSWSFGDWYQVSSSKGSFLRTDGPSRYPTVRTTGGAYNDQTSPLWTNAGGAVEYDIDETGDRAAARSTLTDICDTQYTASCKSDRVYGDDIDIDPLLLFLQGAYLMLDSGSASGTTGDEIVTDRARGQLGVIAIKQTQGGSAPGSPGFCTPTVSVTYSNDGGPADLSPSLTGCSNLAGWDLYASAGAGTYKRLGTLPLNVKLREAGLLLNEQKTYYAAAVGNNGARGSLSQGYTFTHSDTTAPAAPTSVSATATSGLVTVSWTPPGDADVEKFKIYASLTSGGTANLIDGGTDSHCSTTRNVSATPGTYYITVKAVDFAGNHSAASTQVQVTVP